MVWMDRTASRWILAAFGFAVWCAGSVWGLLETTRSYPGIISMKPGRGAFELSEAAFHMSAGKALACLFLLAFAVMAIIGVLRRLLDPDRLALNAVFWVLRSKSLWLALALSIVLMVFAMWVPAGWRDGVDGGIEIAAFLAAIVVPFVAWNAGTLRRDALSAWWRPCWPRWQAILLVLNVISAGLAIDAVFFLAATFGAGWIGSLPVVGFKACLDEIVSFLAWLLIAIVWIERSTIAAGWQSFLGVLRWRRLGPLVWQTLLFLVVLAGVAAPLLMTMILAVYVFPQYDEFAKVSGMPLWWPLRVLSEMAHRFSGLWLLPAVIAMLPTGLAQGRLLVSLGVGDSSPK